MNQFKQKRILILGAGYGGLKAALRLENILGKNRHIRIQLVDRSSFHLLQTRLHEAAGGSIACEDVMIPMSRLIGHRRIDFIRARALGIDFSRRTVDTTAGPLPYEYLIIALGSQTDFFGIPGLAKSALTLKSFEDGCRVRNQVERMIALGAEESDPAERQRMLTIVIGGGGFTGTELAAELADGARRLAIRNHLAPRDVKIAIVEAGPSVLPGFDHKLIEEATRVLKSKGVQMSFGDPVTEVDEGTIQLKSGRRLEARTLIWTGGVRANDLLAKSGLKTGVRGRAVVTPRLQELDHPEVYVIGDSALAVDWRTGRPMGPSAQLALQHASTAAYNIHADLKGLPKKGSRNNVRGEIVSLGRNQAVGLVGPLRITGRPARILIRLVSLKYLLSIGGLGLVLEHQLGTRKAPSARKQGKQ